MEEIIFVEVLGHIKNNGKIYNPGDQIELPKIIADRSIATGFARQIEKPIDKKDKKDKDEKGKK